MAKADETRLRAVLDAIDAATLSQTDLAEAAGISRDSLYQYRMAARRPTPDTVRRIVKALKRQRQAIDRAIERLGKLGV
ncbi:MAG: helix-turn-helix domain-containing protein [Gemmatimonadetes bacterium]|nr:helix-turn-helix domain-containing protein [Gemmatimonadota bacterium]NIO31165.1 helix-turn-helix domain-containing protein [Gemmatimonadota bacterium]